MLKSFRYLLLPFSFLYAIIIRFRNWLYDKKIIKSANFNFPIICVGNIAVGGTGKSPMTEYLVRMLKQDYITATLSRGYKRKTKGFAIASENTTAIDIGDEPMQFHQKFPDITVAVGEERLVAIPQILHAKPETEVIILDDAFQHRQVRAGLNILLTQYNDLYVNDFILPAGDLRDVKSSAKRAQIIIVTKCPANLEVSEKERIINELKPLSYQQVYFAETIYAKPRHLFKNVEEDISENSDVLVICGIANPAPLKNFLGNNFHSYDLMSFPDHHIFRSDDLKDIKQQFDKIVSTKKYIITTEKDGVRLEKYKNELENYPVFVLPISHRIMFNENLKFEKEVKKFIEDNRNRITSQ